MRLAFILLVLPLFGLAQEYTRDVGTNNFRVAVSRNSSSNNLRLRFMSVQKGEVHFYSDTALTKSILLDGTRVFDFQFGVFKTVKFCEVGNLLKVYFLTDEKYFSCDGEVFL